MSMNAAIDIRICQMAWTRVEVRMLGKCHSSVCFKHKPRRIVSPGCFHSGPRADLRDDLRERGARG